MSPPLYLLFHAVFISRCVNTVLSAHTVLCKLFKYSSGRTQTSFSPETSRGESGAQPATRTTLLQQIAITRVLGTRGRREKKKKKRGKERLLL